MFPDELTRTPKGTHISIQSPHRPQPWPCLPPVVVIGSVTESASPAAMTGDHKMLGVEELTDYPLFLNIGLHRSPIPLIVCGINRETS